MSIKHVAPLLAATLTMLLAAPVHATPKTGTRELRIGQQYLTLQPLPNGLVHYDSGGGLTLFGASIGFGRFLTDETELGLSPSITVGAAGNSDAIIALGLEPFFRFMHLSGKVGYFVEVVAGVERIADPSGAATLFDVGLDMGVEFFVTELWAVRLSPGYRRLMNSDGDGVNRLGITWGLAAYF